jgi:hypothetical protein
MQTVEDWITVWNEVAELAPPNIRDIPLQVRIKAANDAADRLGVNHQVLNDFLCTPEIEGVTYSMLPIAIIKSPLVYGAIMLKFGILVGAAFARKQAVELSDSMGESS